MDGAWLSPGLSFIGAEWALEELVDPAARSDSSRASMLGFLAHDYPETGDAALAQLKHLSGIAVQAYDMRHTTYHENLDADEAHELTAEETADIVTRVDIHRPWIPQN